MTEIAVCTVELHAPPLDVTSPGHDERGSGLLTSGIVATLILLIVLLASQILLLLQRSSFADAAAFDAASALAASQPSINDIGMAEEHTRSLLGPLSRVTVLSTDDPVVVRVALPTPGLLRLGPGTMRMITRTAHVRRETFRPAGGPP